MVDERTAKSDGDVNDVEDDPVLLDGMTAPSDPSETLALVASSAA